MLKNAFKDIVLGVNRGETKYMEIGSSRGMIANEHIRIGSNSYEKVKTIFRHFIEKSKLYSRENKM